MTFMILLVHGRKQRNPQNPKNPQNPQKPQNSRNLQYTGNPTSIWEETVTDFIAMEIFSMASIKQNFLNELDGTFYIKRGTYLHCKMFQTATNHIVT